MVKADRLSGKKVIDEDGNIVGEVSGVELEINDWKVNYLYIDLSENAAKQLGAKTSFWSTTTVCLPIDTVKRVGDVITLNRRTNDLTEIAVDPQRVSQKTTTT